jgi:hypothetical protein
MGNEDGLWPTPSKIVEGGVEFSWENLMEKSWCMIFQRFWYIWNPKGICCLDKTLEFMRRTKKFC